MYLSKFFEFFKILCKCIIYVIDIEDISYIFEKDILNYRRKSIVRDYKKIKLYYYDFKKIKYVYKFFDLMNKCEYLIFLEI